MVQEPPRPGSGETSQEGENASEGEAAAEGEGGGDCESKFLEAVARRKQEVSELTTEVGQITVDGDRATAIVHTDVQRTDGSSLSQDVPYDLVRTPEGWRVRISEEG